MGMANFRRLGENVLIQLVQVPATNPADATVPSTYIDVSGYERFAFLVLVGGTDDTAVTMQVVQATAAAGTGKKNVTGAAITGTVLAGTNDNKWALVEVQQNQLDINNSFRYVAVDYAATGGSATASAIVFLAWRGQATPVTQGADKAEIAYVDG